MTLDRRVRHPAHRLNGLTIRAELVERRRVLKEHVGRVDAATKDGVDILTGSISSPYSGRVSGFDHLNRVSSVTPRVSDQAR